MGFGQGYRYAHDEPDHLAPGQTHRPPSVEGHTYYVPGGLGHEARIEAAWAARRPPAGQRPGQPPAPKQTDDRGTSPV